MQTPPLTSRPVVFDPGWLFLLAGLGLLASTVLLPAMDDYTHASWLRDQALLIEQHRTQRVARHDEYLADLHKGDPELLLALAAAQLNQIPVDRAPVPGLTQSTDPDAAVFGALEPDPIPLPDKPRVNTALHRLTTGETTRLWMIVISVVLILVGLLPQARSKPIPAQG